MRGIQIIVDQAIRDIETIDNDLSQGHVSVQEATQSVNHINEGWDNLARNLNEQMGIDLAVAANEIWGQDTFDAFGGIKQGAATGMSSVSSFFNAIDSFKGSWRNPEEARKKIENGLSQISSGVTALGATLNNAARAMRGIGNKLSGAEGHPIMNSIGGLGEMSDWLGGTEAERAALRPGQMAGVAGTLAGIGTGFAASGIIGVAGRMTEAISSLVYDDNDGVITGGAVPIFNNGTNQLVYQDPKDKIENDPKDMTENDPKNDDDLNLIEEPDLQYEDGDNKNLYFNNGGGCEGSKSNIDDYSADMISELEVVLDGSPSSRNSFCTINGNEYMLSGYSLSQELLQPMILSFFIEKEDKLETQSDVVFTDSTELIGKAIEINVSTVKTSYKDDDANSSKKAFVVKGMVINVSASRTTASSQSASLTVATWDAMLQNAPHCRSFENMTLKEIVESVLKPYSEIKAKVNPRFNEKIPYIVQYNRSDYSFVSSLAIRFGEWMYNTGEIFIFGELDDSNADNVTLEYPGGSLMSYGLSQGMSSFSFNHILPDHYKYGKEGAILKESANGIVDGVAKGWTEKAYNASMQRFKKESMTALFAGGFDNAKDAEGADAILDYSLMVESQGKMTGLMSVNGHSKLAMLKIGQDFSIHDGFKNKTDDKNDVNQNALKVIGINHTFDYRQEYSNSFIAVPVECNYPSYSDADEFTPAPPQRAKVVDNKDEQKLGRVRVQFPWQEIQSKEMMTPWLRITVPYAGASKGLQFIPEIGEEVMVGFEMNNVERPYIIGSFYNGGSGKPDEKWAVSNVENNTNNNIKAIRTRNGHTILFNDRGGAGLVEIYDNNNNTYHVTLSADDKKVTIYSAGNVEVIADSNINVSAGGDIAVNAEGDIAVTAKGDIEVKADGDIGIKSKGSISMEAKSEVSIQASKVKVR